ncbi:hypothetical protein M514_07894 [Trichuris suis]|uniref:Uncharacterized protein n=1 Tax=Trichuris suis TaxID=68888 RepID=A0A085M248_9BILA|nr:hypothetical protein M513_07894 [Trichuris suis]KFD63910.1 hypothetical protein M514_07894 [Trichuris suis]
MRLPQSRTSEALADRLGLKDVKYQDHGEVSNRQPDELTTEESRNLLQVEAEGRKEADDENQEVPSQQLNTADL